MAETLDYPEEIVSQASVKLLELETYSNNGKLKKNSHSRRDESNQNTEDHKNNEDEDENVNKDIDTDDVCVLSKHANWK